MGKKTFFFYNSYRKKSTVSKISCCLKSCSMTMERSSRLQAHSMSLTIIKVENTMQEVNIKTNQENIANASDVYKLHMTELLKLSVEVLT